MHTKNQMKKSRSKECSEEWGPEICEDQGSILVIGEKNYKSG